MFSNGPTTVTNGLVLALDAADKNSYPGSGTSWFDLSGNNNTGTLTNGPTFNSGNGGSIFLDGTDDSVPISGNISTNIDSFTSITVEIWVNPTSSIPAANAYGGYISRQTSAVTNYTGFSIRQNNQVATTLEWFGFGATANLITGSVTPNAWNQATGTWSGTVMNFYTNGVLRSTRTNSTNIINATGQTLTLGKLSYGNFFSKSNVAIVKVYNRVLPASEVLQNYNATKTRFGL